MPALDKGNTAKVFLHNCREVRAFVTMATTWHALAWADVRAKYRRTTLGPWWNTISQSTIALMMGLASGKFLGTDTALHLPYFIVSITVWNFIAFSLNESTHTLIQAAYLIKSTNLPLAVHIMRDLQRNFLLFLHHCAFIPFVWLFFGWKIDFGALLVVPGMALVFLFCAAANTVISITCVRYRDIPPLVLAFTQLLFFISPIIWMPEQVHGGQLAFLLNPMSYMIAIVRDPILGRPFDPLIWTGAVVVAMAAMAIAIPVYAKYRGRVVFWV